MIDQLDVSVVVPCLNEETYIERCVRSVLEAFTVAQARGEVLVVDGGSEDATREKVDALSREDSGVKLLDNPNRTTPHALNIGIRASKGTVLIILGAHSWVDPAFVRENLRDLREHPDAGCVGGVLINAYEDDTSKAIGIAMSSSFGVGNARFRTGGEPGYVDTVAFGAYRASVFEKIGLFHEELVRNQDDEFNFRLHKAGYKVHFDPKIISHYYVRASLPKLQRQYFQYGYWKVYVNRMHQSVTTWRQLVPLAFFTYILTWIIGMLFIAAFGGDECWLQLVSAPLVLYVGIVLFISFSSCAKQGLMSHLLTVGRSFFILHFHYGRGYFLGIVQFLLLGKKPSTNATKLTR